MPEPTPASELLNDLKRRVESPDVFVEDDGICLVMPSGSTYFVELARCKTHEAILSWIIHLSEKNWVTPSMLADFAKSAARGNGLPIAPYIRESST